MSSQIEDRERMRLKLIHSLKMICERWQKAEVLLFFGGLRTSSEFVKREIWNSAELASSQIEDFRTRPNSRVHTMLNFLSSTFSCRCSTNATHRYEVHYRKPRANAKHRALSSRSNKPVSFSLALPHSASFAALSVYMNSGSIRLPSSIYGFEFWRCPPSMFLLQPWSTLFRQAPKLSNRKK